MVRRALAITYKTGRRIVIGVVGATVVLIGVAMLVLPGPAFVVIPAGLAILSVEFAWARRWLHLLRDRARGAIDSWNNRGRPVPPRTDPPQPSAPP